MCSFDLNPFLKTPAENFRMKSFLSKGSCKHRQILFQWYKGRINALSTNKYSGNGHMSNANLIIYIVLQHVVLNYLHEWNARTTKLLLADQ